MKHLWFGVALIALGAVTACSSDEDSKDDYSNQGGSGGSAGAAGSGGGGSGGGTGGSTAGTGGSTDGGSGGGTPSTNLVADHTAVAAFDHIPASFIETAKSQYRILYGHTSHGSQITTGIEMLEAELGSPYDYSGTMTYVEIGGDLGHTGDLTWEATTREYLDDSSNDFNMVIWSWCGGCSDNTPEGIQTYLEAMNQLEVDYPGVTFVYMTGHTDGSGESGTLQANNNQIRSYCGANGKILFDFGDIEMWDPAGTYYPDTSDDCGWCSTWCDANDCPSCGDCAHSHCYNCYLKGKGFWWMMARLTGWDGSY